MTGLVGRDADLAVLHSLVDDVVAGRGDGRSTAVALIGEAGIGKSALLAAASGYAARAGVRVLRADGCRAEAELPFATLTHVLLALPDLIDELPEGDRRSVAAILGLDPVEGPGAPTPHLAVLRLLMRAAQRAPVLLVVDDADQVDRDSLQVLLFLARRVRTDTRVGLVLAGRGEARPPADASLTTLTISALDAPASLALLERQPDVPVGGVRRAILDAAAGNPAAIEELALAGSDRPTRASRLVEDLCAERLDGLPPTARTLLLHAAAAAEGEGVEVIQEAAGVPGGLAAWAPAERRGLVVVGPDGVTFRHPLLRCAAYAAAAADERRRAHLALARAGSESSRSAWHRAQACLGTDEDVAAGLADAAEQAERRGAVAEATRAWERAAECTPDPDLRLRRYRRAVVTVNATGDTDWALALRDTLDALTDDPAVRMEVAFLLGATLMLRGRQREAFRVLGQVAEPVAAIGDTPMVVYTTLMMFVAEWSGLPEAREALAAARDHPALQPGAEFRMVIDPSSSSELMATEVRLRRDPVASADALEDALARGGERNASGPDLLILGGIADQSDDVRRGVRLLAHAHASGSATGPCAFSAGMLAAMLVDHGHWPEADALIDRWVVEAEQLRLPFVAAEVSGPRAVLLAMRGDAAAAAATLERARSLVDVAENTIVDVRLRDAESIVATLDGDRASAFRALRGVFTSDGDPRHPLLSARTIARLAAAAGSDREKAEARMVAERVRGLAGPRPVGHTRRSLHHVDALLGPDHDAEHHFRLALSDPAGADWPAERAQVRAHYGQWLRRRRRALDAREMLTASLDAFSALGATAPAKHLRAELRAAGAAQVVEDRAGDALADLTPQQREIVRLAAQGLRNREIAERLFLSPRTVGSHLHHAYPKLGISGRNQLAALLQET